MTWLNKYWDHGDNYVQLENNQQFNDVYVENDKTKIDDSYALNLMCERTGRANIHVVPSNMMCA